jgi:hypothetical protein
MINLSFPATTNNGMIYEAHLCGRIRDGLRYILNPKGVYGKDFPGQTCRVLKEVKQFGEYRIRRLILEAWDELEG